MGRQVCGQQPRPGHSSGPKHGLGLGECLLFTSSFYPPYLHKTSAATLSSCLPSSSSSALTNTICPPPPRLCSGHLWIPHVRPSSVRSPGAVQWSLCSRRCAGWWLHNMLWMGHSVLKYHLLSLLSLNIVKTSRYKTILPNINNKCHICLSKSIKRNIYLLFIFICPKVMTRYI